MSARDGAFEIENLVRRTYEVRAQVRELVGGPHVIRLAEGSAPMVIDLREGAHVLVNVVDATRAPVAAASVRVIGSVPAATTDADGKATITTHPGWIAIEATGRGYAPRRMSVTTLTGITSRITIVLREGFEVRGRVLDQARTPIPNARVYALQCSSALPPFSEEEQATAVTDQRGVFTIPSAVGMHMFFVSDDEHAPKLTPMFDIDRATTNLEIVMRPGAAYAGDVVDAEGKPVAQARVYVDTGAGFGSRRFVASSDASGAFEIRGLPRTLGGTDSEVDVLAYAISEEGVSDTVMAKFAEQPELRDQQLALRRRDTAGVIAGVVVDDTGAPVANVLVNAVASLPLAAMPSWPSLVDSSTATSTRTNPRGEFSISDLPAGDYGLWPGAFDQLPLPASLAQSAAGHDPSMFMTSAKTGDHAVHLVMPRAGRIIGKVTFADTGEPVDDFTTYIDRVGLVPGEHGALDLRDLRPPGSYPLIINRRGLSWTKKPAVRVDAGKTIDVGTITIDRGRTLRGKVVDTAGRAIAGASVRVGSGGVFEHVGRFDEPTFDPCGAITDESGAFTIVDAVPFKSLSSAQTLVVGADHPLHGRALPVAIPPGAEEPAPVTLTLLDCGSIAGKVTRNGQPIEGATIDAGLPAFGTTSANEDGEFVMSRLPAGPVVLRVHTWTDASNPMELLRAHERTVQVEAGRQTSVTIDVPVGTIKLTVVVAPEPGADVAGARLFLFSGTVAFEDYAQLSSQLLNGVQGQADWEGAASRPAAFERLVPGDYTVCTIPLAWSPNDQTQMKRLHSEDRTLFKVYGAPARVVAAPEEQTVTVEVPAMAPLP